MSGSAAAPRLEASVVRATRVDKAAPARRPALLAKVEFPTASVRVRFARLRGSKAPARTSVLVDSERLGEPGRPKSPGPLLDSEDRPARVAHLDHPRSFGPGPRRDSSLPGPGPAALAKLLEGRPGALASGE